MIGRDATYEEQKEARRKKAGREEKDGWGSPSVRSDEWKSTQQPFAQTLNHVWNAAGDDSRLQIGLKEKLLPAIRRRQETSRRRNTVFHFFRRGGEEMETGDGQGSDAARRMEMRSFKSLCVTNGWGPELQDVAVLPPLQTRLERSICFFSHDLCTSHSQIFYFIQGLSTVSGLTLKRLMSGPDAWRPEAGGTGLVWGKLSHQCTNATPEQFPERSALQSAELCQCRTHSQALFKCKSGCVTRLHGAEGGSQMAPCLWRILEVERLFRRESLVQKCDTQRPRPSAAHGAVFFFFIIPKSLWW